MTRSVQRQRIVLATFGSPGDIQPFLAIGLALQARGHLPLIATSPYYRELVTGAGLEFAASRPDRRSGQQDADYLERLARQRRSPAELFQEMFLPSLRESLADLLPVVAGADAVIAHPLVSGARLAAEVHGVPWVSTVMQPMGYLSAHEPPVIGPGWIAGILRHAGPRWTRLAYAAARAITGVWLGEWRALRSELGLPPDAAVPLWEGSHSPLLSLGLFPRLLGEPRVDWPSRARVTGFPFLACPGNALPAPLRAFLAAGHAPIVFTLGTTAVNDPGGFYEESLAAARALGMRSILLVGQGREGRFATGDDAIAVAYAPHALLFPHARAVVHQGGIGTLSEAMRAGKPMLIMPYGHDQADNAWRAKSLGVARVIARRAYRHDRVARALQRLLDNTTIDAAAARVAREMARDDGARAAADSIERALLHVVSATR
jgi:UDP:flavonoid glycosyltransferase YjiC (YdhE family)